MYFNAETGRYPIVKLDDRYAMFTMAKLTPSEIPEGLHLYALCSSDSRRGSPFQVQAKTSDACLGSLLTREAFPLDSNGIYHPEQCTVLKPDSRFQTVQEFQSTPDGDLDLQPASGFLYHSSFGLVPVYPHLDQYCSTDNLYMGLYFYDEEDQYMDHFGDVTVNLEPLPYLHSAIDTNNNGFKILDFLERNGFGTSTEHQIPSGFCQFPIFRFHEEAVRAVDPSIFSAYQSAHRYELERNIQNATDRATLTNRNTGREDPSR